MISVVYLKWLKGNDHPLIEFASSSLSLNSTLATMITYSIPITSISTYTANTKPSTPTSPSQNSLAQTLQQHHSLINTKHSTLTSRCLQYISHILLHSGVHLFHSLFILLIWTTFTIHSYRSKHSHNIHKHIPITSISSTQQTQPSQSTTHKNNTSHSPVVEPFQTLFLSRTLPNTNSHSQSSTNSTLTSGCLQYISHILLHSGVHLFHSLFILLIWTTYTSPPDCPEHPYNIHYPFSITSISSTQQTQPSHKQPHTKQHLSNSFPFTHPAQHQIFTLTLPQIPQHNPPWLPDIQRTFYYLWCSSIPFIVHPIDLNHHHFSFVLPETLSQHPSFTSISPTTNNTTSLYLHNHIPFHISLAQTLHSLLCPRIPRLVHSESGCDVCQRRVCERKTVNQFYVLVGCLVSCTPLIVIVSLFPLIEFNPRTLITSHIHLHYILKHTTQHKHVRSHSISEIFSAGSTTQTPLST